jgi:hypothetical protein
MRGREMRGEEMRGREMRGKEMRGKRRIYSEGRRREVSVNWREGGKRKERGVHEGRKGKMIMGVDGWQPHN